MTTSTTAADAVPSLLTLPSELIHHVLTFLSLTDLLAVSLVNHALLEHSQHDTLYQPFVQDHVPGRVVRKPEHLTWRELFKLHHPYWFIPKSKIWFSDTIHTGKIIIARYDHRLNAIEGYALVAERRQPILQTWDWNPEAIIHTFSPRIQLDLNAPVVRLDARGYENAIGDLGYRLQKEVPMTPIDELRRGDAGLHSQLMLTKPWPTRIISEATPVWPPLTVPSSVRTLRESPSHFRDLTHRPSRLSELSTANFRVKRWMDFTARPFAVGMNTGSRPYGVSMRAVEDITTWATLPEECYTPTAQKPWQGIWCGDYAGHGCEFLVIMQPDDPKPLPARAEWAIGASGLDGSVSSESSDGSWVTAPTSSTGNDIGSSNATSNVLSAGPAPGAGDTDHSDDEGIYRGRIEAVKLTGDPNIPRGEYTFIAPDIGPNGLIRVASEELFKGAHIVKSVGHIAGRGFVDDDYMPSQLILISHDRLAQYWETFGHVSFYQRVNIEEFTKIS